MGASRFFRRRSVMAPTVSKRALLIPRLFLAGPGARSSWSLEIQKESEISFWSAPARNAGRGPGRESPGRWNSKRRATSPLGRGPGCENPGRGPWARQPWSRDARGAEGPLRDGVQRRAAVSSGRDATAKTLQLPKTVSPQGDAGLEVPRGVRGGLEVPPARCAWYYHAHLVLAPLAFLPT